MDKPNSESHPNPVEFKPTSGGDALPVCMDVLSKVANGVNGRIARWSLSASVLVLVAYTLLIQFPNLFEIRVDPNDHFAAILDISTSLTTQLQFEPGSHNEKKTLRPTVPGLVRLLSIESATGIFVLFCVCNILWITFTLRFLRRETGDAVLSFWAVALLCGIYVGGCGFLDTMGWGDIVGFMLVSMALYWHRSWLVMPLLALAMLGDERVVLSSGFIALFLLWETKRLTGSPRFRWMRVAWVATAFFLFLGARVIMQLVLGFEGKSGMLGLKAYLSLDPGVVHAGLWSGFELGWWVMVLSIATWMKRSPLLAVLALLGLLVLLLGSLMVADVTRSLSYGFPWFVISILVFHHEISHPDRRVFLRNAVLVTAVLCALIPGPVVFGHHRYQAPLVLRVLPLVLSKVDDWQSVKPGEEDMGKAEPKLEPSSLTH